VVGRLPPHVYRTADDAYRAMMRGIEMNSPSSSTSTTVGVGGGGGKKGKNNNFEESNTNQSILVSGESGAGKTVTTKIVLNYLAMMSKRVARNEERSSAVAGVEGGGLGMMVAAMSDVDRRRRSRTPSRGRRASCSIRIPSSRRSVTPARYATTIRQDSASTSTSGSRRTVSSLARPSTLTCSRRYGLYGRRGGR
jgi:hypothetical protein